MVQAVFELRLQTNSFCCSTVPIRLCPGEKISSFAVGDGMEQWLAMAAAFSAYMHSESSSSSLEIVARLSLPGASAATPACTEQALTHHSIRVSSGLCSACYEGIEAHADVSD